MSIVEVHELVRTFRVNHHRPGLWGALRGLVDTRGRIVHAVLGVSLSIEPGEFVGFVGPNGAGKSTTLKMLTGILVPTSGEVRVCGLQPHAQRTTLAARIGVVFGQRTQLWWDLPPREAFNLLRHIYGVDAGVHAERVAHLVDRLELEPLLDTPVRKLSLGQKMRCELAAALLHDPEVVFLDEPTIGLDVVVRDEVHRFLRELNTERGTTIVLTSHDLDDIERLCRRVVVIDDGQLLHDGSLQSLRTRYGHVRRIELSLREPLAVEIDLPEGAWIAERDGRQLVVDFDAERRTAPELLQGLFDQLDVVDLAVHEAHIETVIKRLYTEPATAQSYS